MQLIILILYTMSLETHNCQNTWWHIIIIRWSSPTTYDKWCNM